MVLSALTGCAIYDGAATAYARAAVFRQTILSAAERTLAGSIMFDAVRFQFGAAEVVSVARGVNPKECVHTPPQQIVSRSLQAEADLRAQLLSFTNPFDLAEQRYIREWGSSVQTFDPSELPPAVCEQLPDLQQQSLVRVPFAYPTPIVVTPWVERKPRQSCTTCPAVTHCSQLLAPEPRCTGPLEDWWRNATQDFVLLSQGLPLEPRLTATIALGQDCLLPCAHGCVWDCRRPGTVTPLDFHQDPDEGVTLSLDRRE